MTAALNKALVVALLAMKGGVGKTTIALGLTAAARNRGMRVLVADLDPQCNTTDTIITSDFKARLAVAKKRKDEPDALVDILEMDNPTAEDVRRAIYPGNEKWTGVDVLPATTALDTIERAGPDMAAKLRLILGLVAADYDLIVIDCRPAFGMLTTMAAYAAAFALVVAEPAKFGAKGLLDTWRMLTKLVDAGLPDLITAAVITNQYNKNKIEHRQRMAEIASTFSKVMWEDVMPERTVVSLANHASTPIHDYPDPRAPEPVKILDSWLDTILEKAA